MKLLKRRDLKLNINISTMTPNKDQTDRHPYILVIGIFTVGLWFSYSQYPLQSNTVRSNAPVLSQPPPTPTLSRQKQHIESSWTRITDKRLLARMFIVCLRLKEPLNICRVRGVGVCKCNSDIAVLEWKPIKMRSFGIIFK